MICNSHVLRLYKELRIKCMNHKLPISPLMKNEMAFDERDIYVITSQIWGIGYLVRNDLASKALKYLRTIPAPNSLASTYMGKLTQDECTNVFGISMSKLSLLQIDLCARLAVVNYGWESHRFRLCELFDWRNTQEGFNFWSLVQTDIDENLHSTTLERALIDVLRHFDLTMDMCKQSHKDYFGFI